MADTDDVPMEITIGPDQHEHWLLVVDPLFEKDGKRIEPSGQCGGGQFMCGGTGYLHIKIACPACMAQAAALAQETADG